MTQIYCAVLQWHRDMSHIVILSVEILKHKNYTEELLLVIFFLHGSMNSCIYVYVNKLELLGFNTFCLRLLKFLLVKFHHFLYG